jgi:hypothetical protein
MQFLIQSLNEAARCWHNGSMLIPRHRNRIARLVHPVLLLGMVCVLCGALSTFADDDISDLVHSAKPAATAPAEAAAPQSAPGAGVADALGTMKEKPPAGARIGVVTLNDGGKIEGRIWTTLETPLRVWVEETKSYRDLDFSLIQRIDVHVLSATMEDDWRWLKEGSDQKIYSGKKYPNIELAYKFTLLNGQTIEGTVVAPIYTFDGNKRRALALYKKYKGKLDETLKDLVYIDSITLQASAVTTQLNEKKTTKLPLIY